MLMEMIMQKTATGHEEEEENERERNNEIEDENGYEEKSRDSSDDSSSEVNIIKFCCSPCVSPPLKKWTTLSFKRKIWQNQ